MHVTLTLLMIECERDVAGCCRRRITKRSLGDVRSLCPKLRQTELSRQLCVVTDVLKSACIHAVLPGLSIVIYILAWLATRQMQDCGG